MTDERFEKNTLTGADAAAMQANRAKMIEALALIDDKYIDEAREPYDTETVPEAAAAADNAAVAASAAESGRRVPAGTRSGKRMRRLTLWFTSAAAVLVLAAAVTVIVLRGGSKYYNNLGKSEESGILVVSPTGTKPVNNASEYTDEHYPDAIPGEPSSKPLDLVSADPYATPYRPENDNQTQTSDDPEIGSNPSVNDPAADPEKGFPGYAHIIDDGPTYSRAADLAEAAESVFTGTVTGISYKILDENGRDFVYEPTSTLYTVYDVLVNTVFKTSDDSSKKVLASHNVRVAVKGGREDADIAEQLGVMLSSGYSERIEPIPIVKGTVPLSEGENYIFFVKDAGNYLYPLTLGQFAYISDLDGAGWQVYFETVAEPPMTEATPGPDPAPGIDDDDIIIDDAGFLDELLSESYKQLSADERAEFELLYPDVTVKYFDDPGGYPGGDYATCYGVFNGCSVWFIPSMFTAEHEEVIGGYYFYHHNECQLLVLKNGEACQLRVAFRDGLITEADLAVIHQIHTGVETVYY